MTTTTEGGDMTAGLRNYIAGFSDSQRARVRRDSLSALRTAWPHRSTLRGKAVVKANVAMLRNLRSV